MEASGHLLPSQITAGLATGVCREQAGTMRLQQDQVWEKGETALRITRLERHEVEFKYLTAGGESEILVKKEFCRLLKGANLRAPQPKVEPAE